MQLDLTRYRQPVSHFGRTFQPEEVGQEGEAYRVVAPNMPFGGFGHSGIGRENGVDAINEYTETKSVFVELSGGTRDPFQLG